MMSKATAFNTNSAASISIKPHYTLREFALFVGVSYSTAKRMVCTGDVKRIRLRSGGREVVPFAEVERHRARLGLSS